MTSTGGPTTSASGRIEPDASAGAHRQRVETNAAWGASRRPSGGGRSAAHDWRGGGTTGSETAPTASLWPPLNLSAPSTEYSALITRHYWELGTRNSEPRSRFAIASASSDRRLARGSIWPEYLLPSFIR